MFASRFKIGSEQEMDVKTACCKLNSVNNPTAPLPTIAIREFGGKLCRN